MASTCREMCLVGLSISIVIGIVNAPTLRRECRYAHFKVNGELTCRTCPKCPKGEGIECSRSTLYEPDNIPECTSCVDGKTYSDQDDSTTTCYPCTPMAPDHIEVRKCTKKQDRKAECKHGFYDDEKYHQCRLQCCYCHGKARTIAKCVKDGMKDNMVCPPTRADGRCDPLVPPTSRPVTTITSTSKSNSATSSPALSPVTTASPATTTTQDPASVATTPPPPPPPPPPTTTPSTPSTPRPTERTSSPTEVPPPDNRLLMIAIVIVIGIVAIVIVCALLIRSVCKTQGDDSLLNSCNLRTMYGSVHDVREEQAVQQPLYRKSNGGGRPNDPIYAVIQDEPGPSSNRISAGTLLNDSAASSVHTSVEYLEEIPLNPTPVSLTAPSTRHPSRRGSHGCLVLQTPPRESSNRNSAVSQTAPSTRYPSRRGSQELQTPPRKSSNGNSAGCHCPTSQPTRVSPDRGQGNNLQGSSQRGRTRLSRLMYRHRNHLAQILDVRGAGVKKNWLEFGLYIVSYSEILKEYVDNCHECYYGGGSSTEAMLWQLSMRDPLLKLKHFIQVATSLGRHDIVEYLNKHYICNENFFDVSDGHRTKIAFLLEKRREGENCWPVFADKFGFSHEDIEHFREQKKTPQKYSPTQELIILLTAYIPDITVEDLQTAAIAIQRRDVFDCLEEIAQDLQLLDESSS